LLNSAIAEADAPMLVAKAMKRAEEALCLSVLAISWFDLTLFQTDACFHMKITDV